MKNKMTLDLKHAVSFLVEYKQIAMINYIKTVRKEAQQMIRSSGNMPEVVAHFNSYEELINSSELIDKCESCYLGVNRIILDDTFELAKELNKTIRKTEEVILNDEETYGRFYKDLLAIGNLSGNFIFMQTYQLYAIPCITFASFFCESIINVYAIKNLGKSYFKDNLDRLEVKAKWKIIPKLVQGYNFDSSVKEYDDFVNLIRLRNLIAHDKLRILKINPFEKIIESISEYNYSIEDLNGAISAMEFCSGIMKELDSKIENLSFNIE